MSAHVIHHLVEKYLREHPEYQMPESSRHPMVLALSVQVRPYLMDTLGGVGPFWSALLAAAQEWFDPDESSMEYRYFVSQLVAAGGMSAGSEAEAELNTIWEEFRRWRGGPRH